MCANCRAFITTDDRVCPYCDAPVGPRAVDKRNPGEVLGGLIPHAHFTTVILLLINFGFYIAVAVYSMRSGEGSFLDLSGRSLLDFGAMNPTAIVRYGQWWRLVTAGFLHGGIMHILMNSWVLFDLGAQVEEVYGAARMLVVYFIGTICGFYLSAVGGNMLSVGASAGLMGLIGAMIAFG